MKKQLISIRVSNATRTKLNALAIAYGTQAEAVAVAIDRLHKEQDTVYRYEVTYRTKDGLDVVKTVEARNEFQARQFAGAFNEYVFSIVNLDL